MENRLVDSIKGCLYGHAIGDALGVGAESFSKWQVSKYYPEGLRDFDQFIARVRRAWEPGEWTDDTEQMLCVLESLIEKRRVDIIDIARRFLNWYRQGGKGIGSNTMAVLNSPEFPFDPYSASQRIWERSHRLSAANGAVMRTSILGIWDFQDPHKVRENAEKVCKITHYDSRCVASCVMISLLISSLLRSEQDLRSAISDASNIAWEYDPQFLNYLNNATTGSLDFLDLDEGLEPGETSRIGFTYKAMGAGIWALLNSNDFESGLIDIINEGGDSDSNAAVAGALLGSRFGYAAIHDRWKNGLIWRDRLDKNIDHFICLNY